MKFSRILILLISFIILSAPVSDFNVDARKAKTTQVKSSKKKRKKSKSRKKNRGYSSKKNSKGKNKRYTSKWTTPKTSVPAETVYNDSLTLDVNSKVLKWIPSTMNPGGLRINQVLPDKNHRTARIKLNENFTYLPVTKEFIADLEKVVKKSLPDSISDFSVNLTVGGKSLSYYITQVDKLPQHLRKNKPFVSKVGAHSKFDKGMQDDVIALWHSHGRYFKNGGWIWQRPLLFQTVEDIYTMGYVLPYIVPMLENAGAYVMLPRERDINKNEVIVDNDINPDGQIFSQPYYKEQTGAKKWITGEFDGFIYDLPDFRDTENPFEVGTYRQTTTIKSGKPSVAAWYADIPADGEYAIYISYKSLPNSTEDARYTVNYSGGSADFTVNQTMGGSTWIYLGTFPLEKGYSDVVPVVMVNNISSSSADKILTADAVKIGGGMGNIARSSRRNDIYYDPSTPITSDEINQNDDEEDVEDADDEEDDEGDDEGDEDAIDEQQETSNSDISANVQSVHSKPAVAPVFRTSGYPRFLEGARYWLHWAGFPEYVYSPYHGGDDYKDDYTGRAIWVNYLAGGSRVLPDKEGLGIPVDLAMALHSDAGKRADDSTVGTLGIYYTQNGDSYEDGTPRINSRMLTDLLMRQITGDIRAVFEPNWKRRSMWDKSYVEARIPEVPTALIELLSHQNFADMQYGLDPSFRFLVGRAVYKAMARFVAQRKDREVIIQPLPVKDFAIKRQAKNQYRLSWQPTPDRLEPTAVPDKYYIYERQQGYLGFRKIGETSKTSFDIKIADKDIHSFKIVAVNKGGESFPSEILSCKEGTNGKAPVLIVNGFTRVSGPGTINAEGKAGFNATEDFGVPYIKDISFSGYQQEFRRSAGESHGRSDGNLSTQIIAGNIFDYPYVHGTAIAASGYGFVSASVGAVEQEMVKLRDYPIVDLILGKQKETKVGSGYSGWKFKTFSPQLRNLVTEYLKHGGNLFVSGQYIASDLISDRSSHEDRDFAHNVLGIDTVAPHSRITDGRIEIANEGPKKNFSTSSISFNNTLNDRQYIVENPDVIKPMSDDSDILARYSYDGSTAGILRRFGKSKLALLTVPFESFTNPADRTRFMKEILTYLD